MAHHSISRRTLLGGTAVLGLSALSARGALAAGPMTVGVIYVGPKDDYGYNQAHAKGAAALKLEDPRHAMMMAAPPRKKSAPRELQAFVSVEPQPGTVLLWESFLRHEVPVNRAEDERISISFNYNWG